MLVSIIEAKINYYCSVYTRLSKFLILELLIIEIIEKPYTNR